MNIRDIDSPAFGRALDSYLTTPPRREIEVCFSGGEHHAGNWQSYTCRCGAERCLDCDEPEMCETCLAEGRDWYTCPACERRVMVNGHDKGYYAHRGECEAEALAIEREAELADRRMA